MRICKKTGLSVFLCVILVLAYEGFAFGAVSSEEAAKLGTTLTGVGAEMAGNKDGTIPPYTGGLTMSPPNYVKGSGVRPDPFANEKPLFSINAQNMAQYADKLTEGTKVLMKKYSTFRIDVYKSHRTSAFPDYVIKNTTKNAVTAKTANGGLSLLGARGGVPFPIPKDGYEVMWNHLTRYMGRANEGDLACWMVDSNGRLMLATKFKWMDEAPYYDDDLTRQDADLVYKEQGRFYGPARRAGEVAMLLDPLDYYAKGGRGAYQYLPGQRRVKLAPEFGFDTPNFATSGTNVFDESHLFNGSMERYSMQLMGKKEMYVPYNCYRTHYHPVTAELYTPKHLNPDLVRWELHRVWVVEATLKPDKRHIYPKRRFYLDEDSWSALAAENYDALNNMYSTNFTFHAPCYDGLVPTSRFNLVYNFITGVYCSEFWPGAGGYLRACKVRPERDWAPQAMAAQGIR